MLRVVEKPSEANQESRATLDEVLQRGALKMLQQALEAEVEEYITRHRDARDARGRAQVVRNREGAGATARDGERHAGGPSAAGE